MTAPGSTEPLNPARLAAMREDDYCCQVGCGAGGCEACPCCAAGWCVSGLQSMPETDGEWTDWLAVAVKHNPLARAFAAERARVQRVEAARLRWAAQMPVGARLAFARALASDCEGEATTTTEAGYRCPDCTGWFTVSHTCGDRGQHVHIVHTTPFTTQPATEVRG